VLPATTPSWCWSASSRSSGSCRSPTPGELSSQLAPDFLSEFVLYSLSVVDLTMLVGLVFVLARSVIKMLVERKRGLPFARFRAKLVLLLLGMTLIPAVLVLLVGSQLIFNSVDRWFNQPMDEMLDSAQRIASDYYHDRQQQVTDEAARPRARRAAGPGGHRCARRARRSRRPSPGSS
jgi:two-component system nitrogen regulation sensor histidine kinase NtrY